MKRKQIKYIGFCLVIGLIIGLIMVLPVSCSCSTKSTTTTTSTPVYTSSTLTSTSSSISTTTATRTTTTTTTSTPPLNTTTSKPASISTTLTSFPYHGSGTGVWSGQIVYNNKTYSLGGNLTMTIDANGVVTGSITNSTGANVTIDQNKLQVDPNGNITGISSFSVNSITFTFNWQGKVTVSGNAINIQGTWTGQYGSGIFSGTGTTSN
jgi:hypothetical protein